MDASPSRRAVGVLLVGLVGTGLIIGLFVVDPGEATPEPVDFEDTVPVGLTLEDEFRLEEEYSHLQFPQVQVFYSQYPYPVGYYGVEQFVTDRRLPGHDRQFGHSMGVYVTVFDHGHLTSTPEGYPEFSGQTRWVPAEEAIYLVGSELRTTSGPTAIPFTDEDRAAEASAEFGGELRSWNAVLAMEFDRTDADAVRERTVEQQQVADQRVEERMNRSYENGTTRVGEDAATIQEAVNRTPANGTVEIPGGTYPESVTIDRPIHLRGEAGAQLDGGGNGTVINVTAPNVTIEGLTIAGVGDRRPVDLGWDDHDHGEEDAGDWDEGIEEVYARGDAGLTADGAPNLLIDRVSITTPASGVILRESPDFLIRESRIDGHPDPFEGHMGIVAMRSTGIVEETTIVQGRDAIYTHRADGIVLRNNTVTDNRIGLHLMHTSNALLADNRIARQDSTGIFVMTGPEANSLVGNTISQTSTGIDIGGSDSYLADNRLFDNRYGVQLYADSTLIERNVIVANEIGIASQSLLPTNRVESNDFVDNGNHVGAGDGPLRIWTHDNRGNYWEGAIGTVQNGTIDRAYTATSAVDGALHRVDGTRTLAHAPGVQALAGVATAIAGMQDGEILDLSPRCDPVHSDWLAEDGYDDLDPHCPGES